MSTATRATIAALPISLLALPAFAQTLIEVDASTAVEAGFTAAPLTKPIDAVRARAQEIKKSVLPADQASGTPAAPMRLMERPIGARAVEIATSSPRSSLQALVRIHLGNIEQRLSAVLAHLSRFLERIDARVEKMAAGGADVAALSALKADAETSIAAAKIDVAALATMMNSISAEDDRVSVRAEIDAAVGEARESVRAAHGAVADLVKALVAASKESRGASIEADVSADLE